VCASAGAVFGQTARTIVQKTFPSVVLLLMSDAHGQDLSLGSGFFVGNGIIATNLHVIEGAGSGYAKNIGESKKLTIVGVVAVDESHDLALLSVDAIDIPSIPLGNSDSAEIGDAVYVIGNPEGLEGTLSQGIISGIRNGGLDKLLQIRATIYLTQETNCGTFEPG
jgi:S1-C subfamily serine protease